jgi:hypothetical protein
MEAFSTLEDIFSLIFVGNIDWFLSSNQHAVFGSLIKMAELRLLRWQTLKQCFNISFNSLWEAHYIRVLFLTDNFISFWTSHYASKSCCNEMRNYFLFLKWEISKKTHLHIVLKIILPQKLKRLFTLSQATIWNRYQKNEKTKSQNFDTCTCKYAFSISALHFIRFYVHHMTLQNKERKKFTFDRKKKLSLSGYDLVTCN